MKKELAKQYDPFEVEDRIYQQWEKSGYFNPDNLPEAKSRKPFSVAMPPPNVTGDLHLGHAITLTIEDIVIRYKRMRGYAALWLPGTDPAGISTQIMVERLIKKEGLDRHKLGRQKFLERVWLWKKEYGDIITKQVRKMGASCDWSREHFTLDPELTKATQTAFIQLFNDGLIYRGDRIINWCPRCASAISDLEVDHKEQSAKLWHIKYPLKDSAKFVTVATSRPETMLGDSAIAVNPEDKRYKELIGQSVILPLLEREIPIIADRRVDLEFGTGAVKVTPAHDPLDWEIGQEHNLPTISVINEKTIITENGGPYAGLKAKEARLKIIEDLQKLNLLAKEEDYQQSIARCQRCNTIVEPLISKQWFVKIKPLAETALAEVKKGKVKITPDRFAKVYYHWMENIKDWCISRQLWWGHQIPIWYCQDCQEPTASVKQPTSCKKCQGKKFIQEEDTLDTWFSSGLWTFSTLGWPNKTQDLKRFHPTNLMETGWDILFFWVARMMMLSLYLLKQKPFNRIYLHGLILDKNGQKMSKSKGTGLDPLVLTSKYGTDALRLALIIGNSAGQDFRLYEEKVAGYRNFANKLWNVSRYILGQEYRCCSFNRTNLGDKWITARLHQVIKETTDHLENYNFSEAGNLLYEFVWHELADWYLEITKHQPNTELLYYLLINVLRLLHPFMPFITEEIWSQLPHDDLLIVTKWPEVEKSYLDQEAIKTFEQLQQTVTELRNYKKEKKIQPKEITEIKKNLPAVLKGQKELIEHLARVKLV